MLKGRALKVTMVKDEDITTDAPPRDAVNTIDTTIVAATIIAREATKMIAATLVMHAGCKILVNRLSK